MQLLSIAKYVLLITQLVAPTYGGAADWQAKDGKIFFKDAPFNSKGLSFFGLETCAYTLHGLFSHPLEFYLDFAIANKFNILRIPFSEQWVKNSFETQYPSDGMVSADPNLQGKTTLYQLDRLFDLCAERGIFIMMDLHRLSCSEQSVRWYSTDNGEYTDQTFIDSWQKVLDRYENHPAFFCADVFNEPRWPITFGDDPSTSWNLFIESVVARLNSSTIFNVQGIDWGHDLSGLHEHPIRIDPRRIIYSPHVYGVSVVGNMDLNPNNLHAHWDHIFGFLLDGKHTVSIGEWGGRYTGDDKIWQDLFVDYLISKNARENFVWDLNPNSGDTGGILLDDWTSPNYDKLRLLEKLQPNPTLLGPQTRHLNITTTEHRNLRG